MDLYGDYGHDTIPFLLRSKQRVFYLDPISIQEYLPVLWDRILHGNLERHGDGCLRPEDLGFFRDPTSQGALVYLFNYLEELQRTDGVSGALDNSLEHLWKTCKTRSRHRHSRRHLEEVTAVFCQLGKILDDNHFGCNEIIFATMSTFFIRHCTEIMRRGSRTWVDFIFALERMAPGDELIPALTCVAQQNLPPDHIVESAYGQTPRGHTLYPRTIDLLRSLMEKKNDQDQDRYLTSSGFWGHEGFYVPGGGRRGGAGRRGGRDHGNRMRCGTEYDPQALEKIVIRDPGAIFVDEGLRRRPQSHHRVRYIEDDYYSDSDSDPEYNIQYARMQLPAHRMRRARRDLMIEDGGRRRHSMSMDGLDRMSMGDFVGDMGMKQPGRGFGGRRPELMMR